MPKTISRQKSNTVVYDCNAVNRGVYIADNLDFLRSLNDACIDLVCIDPPFDKNETFVADKPSRRLPKRNGRTNCACWPNGALPARKMRSTPASSGRLTTRCAAVTKIFGGGSPTFTRNG